MKKVSLLAAFLFIFGCGSEQAQKTEDTTMSKKTEITGAILFGKEYTNRAFGYQHRGWLVDGNGEIYRFELSRGDSFPTPDNNVYSAEQIGRLMALSTPTGKEIPEDTLAEMIDLIKPAAAGELTERVQRGADMGQTTTFAFEYDPVDSTYTRYLLSARGDWEYRNDSEAATRLDEYLSKYLKD